MRRRQPVHSANGSVTLTPELGHQVSSVATLLLSITIPIATMVLAWQWAFPLVPLALVPYLVGIVVQFTFEHLARYWKSPSWTTIFFIFHVSAIQYLFLVFACLIKTLALNILVVGFFLLN